MACSVEGRPFRGEPIPDDRDDAEATKSTSEESARRVAAAISGAIDGFLEGLENYDLGASAEDALTTAGDVARAAGEEGANQAATPEMRQIGRGLQRAGGAAADVATNAADAVRDAAHNVAETAREAKHNVQEKVADARERVEDVAEDVRVKAGAVAETSRRAARAPPRIAREWREAASAWWAGLKTATGLMALLGVIGLTAWVLLTIALVVGLNQLIGDPAGTFAVFGIYLIGALGCYAGAKAVRHAADKKRAMHILRSREEVRHVTRPVREAFAPGASRRRSV